MVRVRRVDGDGECAAEDLSVGGLGRGCGLHLEVAGLEGAAGQGSDEHLAIVRHGVSWMGRGIDANARGLGAGGRGWWCGFCIVQAADHQS